MNNSQNIAVLIHPPEHYDRSGKHLLGRQSMRKRHLAKMGFKIMEFRMDELAKLRVYPQQLHNLLSNEYAKIVQSKN